MPLPGATTSSTFAVCLASLAGWSIWQREHVAGNLAGEADISYATTQATTGSANSLYNMFSQEEGFAGLAALADSLKPDARQHSSIASSEGDVAETAEFPHRYFEPKVAASLQSKSIATEDDGSTRNEISIDSRDSAPEAVTDLSWMSGALGLAIVVDILAIVFMVCGYRRCLSRGPNAATPVASSSADACTDAACDRLPSTTEAHGQQQTVQQQEFASPHFLHDEFRAQIETIMGMSAEHRKQPFIVPCSTDGELKTKINSIVATHKEHRSKQSEAAKISACSGDNVLVAFPSEAYETDPTGSESVLMEDELQAKIKLVQRDAADRRQRELASSPASRRDVSEADFVQHIEKVLSAAKERGTPAKSPGSQVHWEAWEAYEEEPIVPCQLDFCDSSEASARQLIAGTAKSVANLDVHEVGNPVATADGAREKVETDTFDVTKIPSPTRSRARAAYKASQAFSQDVIPDQPSSEVTEKAEEASSRALLDYLPSSKDLSSYLPTEPPQRSERRRRSLAAFSPGGTLSRMLANSATPTKSKGTRGGHGESEGIVKEGVQFQ